MALKVGNFKHASESSALQLEATQPVCIYVDEEAPRETQRKLEHVGCVQKLSNINQTCKAVGFQMVTGFLQAPPEHILKNKLSMESGMLHLVFGVTPICQVSSSSVSSAGLKPRNTKEGADLSIDLIVASGSPR